MKQPTKTSHVYTRLVYTKEWQIENNAPKNESEEMLTSNISIFQQSRECDDNKKQEIDNYWGYTKRIKWVTCK